MKNNFFISTISQIGGVGTTPSIPLLSPILQDDLLVFFLAGQSNALGQSGTLPSTPYDYTKTLTSQIFRYNDFWSSYVSENSNISVDNSFMHRLDDLYPGQIALIKYAFGGTRLRQHSLSSDWNVNTVGELYEGSLPVFQAGLTELQAENPTKNIRLIQFIWMQGEADAMFNEAAGDPIGYTEAQAKAQYKSDLHALLNGWLYNINSFGFPPNELQFSIGLLNNGPQVTNRPYYTGIREAQQEVADERSDSINFDQVPYSVYPDGVHHTDLAQLEMGEFLTSNHILPRFST